MKFDIIIANPPYKGGKHTKFLNDSYEKLNNKGDLIFLHPASKFINGPRNILFGDDKLMVEFPEKEIKSLEFFTNIFENVALGVPLSITHVIKNYDNNGKIHVKLENSSTYSQFKELREINIFGNNAVASLLKKFKNIDSIKNHLNENGKWFVEFTDIRGHHNTDDFYTIISKQVEPTKKIAKKFNGHTLTFAFKTEIEAQNFILYLKTKFAQRLVSLLKNNHNLSLRHPGDGEVLSLIPWLDFTKNWNDEKLFKKFNLKEEEKEFINSLPNYYAEI